MKRRDFVIFTLGGAVGLSSASRITGQKKTIEPDLAQLGDGKGLKVFNRTVTSLDDGAKKGVRLSESADDGVAYFQGIEFTSGTIEFDVRGKTFRNRASSVLLFTELMERPMTPSTSVRSISKLRTPARRIRAVQYISHPTYTWQKLRTEHPGKYEKAVNPVPDPNGWFHVRVVVASPKVSVFVADAKEPSLVVDQLSDRRRGLVGLWVGNSSSGDFANVKITPD